MKNKTYALTILITTFVILSLLGIVTVFVDPYFHYHKPQPSLRYPFASQVYTNDGILKNFDYDAVITGTSMTENFYTSQLDEKFGVNSVKVPISGEYLYEVNNRLQRAFKNGREVKMVLRALDLNILLIDKDLRSRSNDLYPDYLYDNNIFNDVYYLLNKDVYYEDIYNVLQRTISGKDNETFDEYSNWMENDVFGKAELDKVYSRQAKQEIQNYTDEDYEMEINNLKQNVIQMVIDHPKTEFYYFIPPFSIYYFDLWNQNGELQKILKAQEVCIESLIDYDNVRLFAFHDDFEMICNLDNYKDPAHYGDWINTYMIECMANNTHLLTKDNYKEYIRKVNDFYLNYDYDALFKE